MWFSKKQTAPAKETRPKSAPAKGVAKPVPAPPAQAKPAQSQPLSEEAAATMARTLAKLMRGETED